MKFTCMRPNIWTSQGKLFIGDEISTDDGFDEAEIQALIDAQNERMGLARERAGANRKSARAKRVIKND